MKNKLKRRGLSILLLLGLTLSMLSACGTESEVSTDSASVQEKAAVASTAAPAEQIPTADGSAEDEISAEEPEASVVEINYPLEGNPSFSVLYSKPTLLDATIMQGTDYDSSLAWNAMVEATGVTLEWESVSEQAWDTQISLIMAAGDYPDACNSNVDYTTGKTGLVEDEVMLDLSGYIAEHMPNYNQLLKADTAFADCVYEPNGMLVQIQSRAGTFINAGLNIRQDWLDELQMDTPTTVEELTDFLLACKDKYGLTNAFEMTADLNCYMNYAFNTMAEGDRMQYQLAEEGSDEIVWSATTQNFRDYIAFLRDWYEQGIFNDDYLNISNPNGNVQSTFLEGNTAAWGFDCSALLYDDLNGVPMADLKLYNDESTNISGVTQEAKTATTGMMMVFSACDDPATFCEFIDYFFSPEGNLLANWGVENETYTIKENGEPTYVDAVWNDTECFMYLLRSARYGLYWAPCDFDVSLMIADYTEEQQEAVDMWVSTRGSYLCTPPNFQLTADDRDIVNEYETDCCTYFWEHVHKTISGQETMEELDSVIQTAMDMGMTEVVDAYNHSYQSYLETYGA